MYKFKVSAPGRIFISGDPMRYKKICIAASLNMRTKLAFSSPKHPSEYQDIEINFSDIRLHIKIPLQIFFLYFGDKYLKGTLTNAELHEGVKNFVSSLKRYTGTYEPHNHVHYLSLQAFFFLLVLIANEKNIKIKSFIVKISSELMGKGLGCSASFSTCLAGCFYRWSYLQKGVIINFDKHLKNICQYVQKCDCTIYNTSTVIDSFICVYGSIQVFREEAPMNMFCELPNIKIILVFSNTWQRTLIAQSERTNRLRQSYPFTESIQKSIDELVEESIDIFEDLQEKILCFKENHTYKSDEDRFHLVSRRCCVKLSSLIQMNQGLLRALDMSSPNLDIICAIAQKCSLAGKLTSNGGGGFAFILLLPNSTFGDIRHLLIKLKSYGFPTKIANLNCSGLRLEK